LRLSQFAFFVDVIESVEPQFLAGRVLQDPGYIGLVGGYSAPGVGAAKFPGFVGMVR
jgi:hypothetical protein